MNTYIALCLLAIAGVSHGSAIGYGWGGSGWDGLGYGWGGWGGLGWDGLGWGGKIIAPAAVSTASVYKPAVPSIPVLRTYAAPLVVKEPLGLGWSGYNPWGWGGKGWGGYGWSGYGWGKL